MTTVEEAKRAAAQRREIAQGGLASENLTVRDYFAAKALQGSLNKVKAFSDELNGTGKGHIDLCDFMAVMAYKYADAMLKARKA